MENVDFLQPLLYTRIMYFNPDFIDTSHITQTGYFVCRWQTLQHLVLIMLNAQFERVTAAVQVASLVFADILVPPYTSSRNPCQLLHMYLCQKSFH